MAQSLLDALEGSLRIFEKHRMFLLSCSVNRPTKGESSKRPDPARNSHDGSGLATTPAARGAMTYEPPPHLPPGFGTRRDTKSERKPRTCRGLQLPNKGETLEDLKSLSTPRYYPEAQIAQGADRISAPTRRRGSATGRDLPPTCRAGRSWPIPSYQKTQGWSNTNPQIE
jgi:hypothetical protein